MDGLKVVAQKYTVLPKEFMAVSLLLEKIIFFFFFWIKDTVDKKVTEAIDICRIIYEVNTLFF